MDRQAILRNLVTLTRGLGQSIGEIEGGGGSLNCLYFPEDHPGCGIGCQPGFREKFQGVVQENKSIQVLLDECPGVAEFFGVEPGDPDDEDYNDGFFLEQVQELHDTNDN